ncbi:MAG: tail fiber domain-containing protein [Phaeodactylibacter sp.]|nr:tail fiber domain-containing protein [Phaeodactylibacter sp.]MCB9274936.1 tail fiber domain-containing protein [Lewinellaceae bacterium]
MPDKLSRGVLRTFFETGDVPTQKNFEDFIESYLNSIDDGVNVDVNKNLLVSGAVKVGNQPTDPTEGGYIRWNGSQFQGFNGTSWEELGSGGGGGDTIWQLDGNNAHYGAGTSNNQRRVGIGTSSPNTALHIENGNSMNAIGATGRGYLTLGTLGGTHMIMDNNEIVVRNVSGVGGFTAGDLDIQRFGGNINMGGAGASQVSVTIRGNLSVTGTVTASNIPSDERLKEGVRPLELGLETLLRLNPIRFSYNGKGGIPQNGQQIGLSAQNVRAALPEAAPTFQALLNPGDEAPSTLLGVDPNALIALLINAVKQLTGRVAELEKALQVEGAQ